MSLQSYQQFLIGAGALATALLALRKFFKGTGALWRMFVNKIFNTGEIKADIEALRAESARTAIAVNQLIETFKNNGGGSIKDQLDRMEYRQSIQEQRQRAMLSLAPGGVFELDSEGRCVWVNRRYSMMTGRLSSELLGFGWRAAIAFDERENTIEKWSEAIRDQREIELDYTVQTPDGERFRVFARQVPLMTHTNEIGGYLVTIHSVGSRFGEQP